MKKSFVSRDLQSDKYGNLSHALMHAILRRVAQLIMRGFWDWSILLGKHCMCSVAFFDIYIYYICYIL